MRADLEFADDCHGDIAVIAGIRLLAFKVGHKLLLQRMRSPFAIGGRVGIKHLLQAIRICSRSYVAAASELYSARLRTRLAVQLWTYAMSYRAQRHLEFVSVNSKALFDYITDCERDPENIFVKTSVPRTHVPFIPLLIEELCAHYNYTPDQVLEMPMRKAIILRFQSLVKPDSGLKWRESWMEPQEVSHAE